MTQIHVPNEERHTIFLLVFKFNTKPKPNQASAAGLGSLSQFFGSLLLAFGQHAVFPGAWKDSLLSSERVWKELTLYCSV